MNRSDRPPVLIREAGASDLGDIGSRVPEALGGSPPAKVLLAADASTLEVVGAAALRVFSDGVGRFLLYVDPQFRRRGCGTALLNDVRGRAVGAGAKSLLSVRSYEQAAQDALTLTARAFFQARGLGVLQEIRRYRVDLKSALDVLEPLYQRFIRRPAGSQSATFVPAGQVDPNALAAFAVRHVGGLPEVVAQRLRGFGHDGYSPTLSLVAMAGNQIVGALLSVPLNSSIFLIETRVIDPAYRRGGLNLALMYRAALAGRTAGVEAIEFEHDTLEADTTKLVGRLGAVQVGCRQCYGVALSEGGSPAAAPVAAAAGIPHPLRQPEAPMLRAAHTPNFPALLRDLGSSLLVTTYQAGKLALIRDEGDHLNAHVRSFPGPMGLAVDGDRLAIGIRSMVWEFVNVPAVAAKLNPPGKHDACFLPRSCHITGDIQIHEMAWGAGGELWVVNTRFSCLCTLDRTASFRPRWRPRFVSELEPSDRCHLNGLAMIGGKPKYVTALGETNTPGGWRTNKARGGVVIDVESGEAIARGLSMPHSPRWHAGRLWVCESGAGTLGTIDLNTGKYEPVAEVPGFTRGLDFAGPYAFVGLSQVRESAVFSGIAITERLPARERTCGIAVLDLRSGQTAALLRSDAGVQEVFAVAVLGRRYPDLINDNEKLVESSFVVPAECLGEVAASVRRDLPLDAAGSVHS